MTEFVFAIRDVKAESFTGSLVMVPARGIVVRSFTELVNDKSTEYGKYPADFHLFEVGTFDRVSGRLSPRDGGELDLGSGLAYQNRLELVPNVVREA